MEPRLFQTSLRIACLASIVLMPMGRAHADAYDNWQPCQVTTGAFAFLGVAYGNGRYVAVGQYEGDVGIVQTSDDGLHWTKRTPSGGDTFLFFLDLFDVTFGNNVFVAVGWDWFGGANIYHSTNGIAWTPHTTAIGNINRVIFGDDKFVAVGDGQLLQSSQMTNYNIYTSPDGSNWTPQNCGAPDDDVHSLFDVAYGDGRFVAVDGQGYFYTSTNGAHWTRTFDGREQGRISFCNGLFFAAAGAGTNLVSTDGLAWSTLTNGTGNAFQRVIFAGGSYVALSRSGLFTSRDGTNWVQRSLLPAPDVTLTAVAHGRDRLLVVGAVGLLSNVSPAAYVSDPSVALEINRTFPPELKVSGLVGQSYQIDYLDSLVSNSWRTLTSFSLSNSPSLWTDFDATNSAGYYRAVLLP